MGLVYHAIDPSIGRPVAIKTIRLSDVHDPAERGKLRERLSREARAAGILSHPNIVTIYDIETEGELAYIAMEFVDGQSLEQIMAEGRPLDASFALAVLRQTAGAVDYAHSKGIVHRDIKPGNILIAGNQIVKVTDFGIAKATANDQFTMTGVIVGTPNYMAPEQVQGLILNGRADQFSLAVIAFELFTGEKPFTGEHLTTVVYKIVAEEPIPPQRLNGSLGTRVDAVIRKALAKKPEGRYATCAEFVGALEAACEATRSVSLTPRGASSSLPTVVEAPWPEPPRMRETSVPPKRTLAAPLLAALLVAGGLIGLIAWQANPAGERKQETPSPVAAPPPKAEVNTKPSPIGPPATSPETTKPTEANGEEPQPNPETETPPEPKPRQRSLVEQPIHIATDPAGAVVVLNRDPQRSCETPCFLEAPPGRHAISITLPGHQEERREVMVGESPQELPLITLRRFAGTLMLSSSPPGASISINGKVRPETTPARLQLAPGSYSVVVEKDGMRKTLQVEIRNGVTKYQPVQLGS
jgi:serine/threonine-protein kinase